MAENRGFKGAAVPGAKRISRTGLALVHENEVIYPAVGNEAQAVQALEDARTRIDVWFPIEIEIREAAATRSPEVRASSLDKLVPALRRR